MKTTCKCGGIVTDGVCNKCKPVPQREGSTARGYDYKWQKLRKRFLQSHPICQDCFHDTRATTATEVHHIRKIADRPDLRLDEDNLMALCTSCHQKRTGRGE